MGKAYVRCRLIVANCMMQYTIWKVGSRNCLRLGYWMQPWAGTRAPRDGIFRAREDSIDCFLRTKLISSLVGGREVISRPGKSVSPETPSIGLLDETVGRAADAS